MLKIRDYLEKVFYYLFFILFILSFLLIETEFRYWLFAAWSVFLLIYSLCWKIRFQLNFITALLLLFLFLLTLACFFSHYPLLSVSKLLFYYLAVALYLFFRFLPKKIWDYHRFFDYFLLLGAILNVLVLILFFFPELKFDISGMNLLVRSYGHNHYVAFLLLLLPIYWRQFSLKKNFLSIFLIISSYLLVFTSLGRVAVLIAFWQFLLIFISNQQHYRFGQSSATKFLSKSLLLFFSMTLLGFFLFLTPFGKKESAFCQINLIQKELCNPIHENARFSYWRNAWQIIKHFPVFGYGLKTFYFASRHLVLDQTAQSAYAHNIFLHLAAESGFLVAMTLLAVFIVAFLLQLKALANARRLKKPINQLSTMLFLAVFSSLLNACFDFDFNFFIIFSLSLIFLAILDRSTFLVDQQRGAKKNQLCRKIFFKNKLSNLTISLLPITIVLSLINGFFLGNYLLASYFLKQQQLSKLLMLLPTPELQKEIMLHEKELSTQQFEKLFRFYKNDSGFIFYLVRNEELDEALQLKAYLQLMDVDMTSFLKSIDLEKISQPLAKQLVAALLFKHQQGLVFVDEQFIDWQQRLNLAKQVFTLANQNYEQADYFAADQAYLLSYALDEFIFSNERAIFLDENDPDLLKEFLKLTQIQPQAMQFNFYNMMNLYEVSLVDLFKKTALDDFFVLANKIFAIEPNFAVFLFKKLIEVTYLSPGLDSNSKYIESLSQIYQYYIDLPAWEELKHDLLQVNQELIFQDLDSWQDFSTQKF